MQTVQYVSHQEWRGSFLNPRSLDTSIELFLFRHTLAHHMYQQVFVMDSKSFSFSCSVSLHNTLCPTRAPIYWSLGEWHWHQHWFQFQILGRKNGVLPIHMSFRFSTINTQIVLIQLMRIMSPYRMGDSQCKLGRNITFMVWGYFRDFNIFLRQTFKLFEIVWRSSKGSLKRWRRVFLVGILQTWKTSTRKLFLNTPSTKHTNTYPIS